MKGMCLYPEKTHAYVYTKYHILCQGILRTPVTQWPMVPQLRTPDMLEVEVKGKYPEALKLSSSGELEEFYSLN